MEKMNKFLQKIEMLIGCTFFCILFIFIVINIVNRYFLNSAISWSDELSNYLFVWTGYMAVSYATGEDNHVRITFLESRLSFRTKQIVRSIFDVITGAAFLMFCIPAIRVLPLLRRSPAMRIPLQYVYIILPIAFCLIGVHSIHNITRRIQKLKIYKKTGIIPAGEEALSS